MKRFSDAYIKELKQYYLSIIYIKKKDLCNNKIFQRKENLHYPAKIKPKQEKKKIKLLSENTQKIKTTLPVWLRALKER